ncbi:hypothetical protein F3Y22_tig00110210pilonHSYRG00021 [Hibiscus syriacus]|uniref:Reverse transcriptase Ty1/copia-type domain-containing protein n=1 Tax=Hibiscus syriacus TaxID=106335 RepID=A0A6A3B941_HIBSY|nr:hypothetical protein F3Y22_tig00110210pilonHSYRG00021 [Hibiscus syriacus]
MTQDVEMKEQPTPSNSVSFSSPSTLHHLKEIASLIETNAYDHEAHRILRAIRLTMALRRKLKPSVLSSFLTFTLNPGSEALSRLKLWLPPYSYVSHSLTFSRLEPGGKLIMCFRKASIASASDQVINENKTSNGISMYGDISASKDKTADILYNYLKIVQDAPILGKPTIFVTETMGSSGLNVNIKWRKLPSNLLLSSKGSQSVKQGSQGKPKFKVESPVWITGKLYRLETVKDVHILELSWVLPCLLQEYLKKPEDYLAHLLGHVDPGRVKSIKMASTSGSFSMEESRPIDVPPHFNGTNYRHWKRCMMIFIKAFDMEAWMIIKKGYSSPTKKAKKWSVQERKKAQQNSKAIHMLCCAIDPNVYKGVYSCSSAKEMWDKLEEIYRDKEEEEPIKVVSLLALTEPKVCESNGDKDDDIQDALATHEKGIGVINTNDVRHDVGEPSSKEETKNEETHDPLENPTIEEREVSYPREYNYVKDGEIIEPKNIKEALNDEHWIMAMQEELNQFERSKVCTLVERPSNKSTVGTRWVFRNKLDESGNIVRNKARLVAQGYTQKDGIDYDETYATVARMEAIRMLLAFACFEDSKFPDHVLKLTKALYGLKQAPRSCEFEMSMMGDLSFFLGLQIKHRKDGIFINQAKYVKDMLKKFGLENGKPHDTPMSSSTKLDLDEGGKCVDVKLYRFQSCPKESHLLAVKRIFRYLKDTPSLGLWYPRDSSFSLHAFSDADYGGCKLDRKSTSGTFQFLGNMLISWFSKKQNCVALSTTEAEYISADS